MMSRMRSVPVVARPPACSIRNAMGKHCRSTYLCMFVHAFLPVQIYTCIVTHANLFMHNAFEHATQARALLRGVDCGIYSKQRLAVENTLRKMAQDMQNKVGLRMCCSGDSLQMLRV